MSNYGAVELKKLFSLLLTTAQTKNNKMQTTFNTPTLRIPKEIALPDNDQWQFRFEIKSETSDSLYTIAQNKKKKHWGCSCFAYRRYRACKHLTAMGIPTHEQPYEPKIIQE